MKPLDARFISGMDREIMRVRDVLSKMEGEKRGSADAAIRRIMESSADNPIRGARQYDLMKRLAVLGAAAVLPPAEDGEESNGRDA